MPRRFYLAGALATMVESGAALSAKIGGVLIQRVNYQASFLGLAAVASAAFGFLWLAIAEALDNNDNASSSVAAQKQFQPSLGK